MISKLTKSNLFSILSNMASYLWFFSVIAFITVIILSTQNYTVDPCYGKGCSENGYLLPMLLSLGTGVVSFIMMVLFSLIRRITKSEIWRPPLNINSLKVGLVTIVLCLLFFVYTFASFRNNTVGWGGTYTGEDLFSAVNMHRKEKGIPEVVLSEGLCDNLVSRWQAVKEGRQHKGFDEWIDNEGIQTNYGYKDITELYIQSSTPAEAISFWAGSPGHRIQLENSKWTDGCAYANEGYGVVVMSFK
jgi:uncharacterized membrane protein